ncbi:unnamed protein product [Rhizophagus irregularis]|nr:unnamed protein product [Rhizophagus irregularis]
MQELPSVSKLIESTKNNHEYREFHENKDKWLIDQNYFNDTYEVDGKLILYEELERQAREEAAKIKITKA